MSDPASGHRTPLRRPDTARPRTGSGEEVPPPTQAELAAVERQLAGLPGYSGASESDDESLRATLVRLPGRGPGVNFAACIRWPAGEVSRLLPALERQMRADGEWPALVVAEGITQPATLENELARAGWMQLERERVMWTRRPPVVPHLDPSTRLEAVTRRTAAEHERLEREVFGLPEGQADERAERLAEAVEGGRLRAFLVRIHGQPVAVARLALAESVAGIYGVGVTASHRRQGYGGLVTAIATRSGLATGKRLVWLSVGERNQPAQRLYTALGYAPSVSWARWLAPARP